MRYAIVTASDSAFMPMLRGLLASIEVHRPLDPDITVLDVGLSQSDLIELAMRGVGIVKPGWDYPGSFPEYFKAMTARPHLPKWVPGYDIYVWIDADAWVQDWSSVEMLIDAAAQCEVAAVPEADRLFPEVGPDLRRFLLENLFGKETTETIVAYPQTNSGVFAAAAESSLWRRWSARTGQALRSAKSERGLAANEIASRVFNQFVESSFKSNTLLVYLAEQTAFHVALHIGLPNHARLRAIHNWPCHACLPHVGASGDLVEPSFPFERIGIVHMTLHTKYQEHSLRRVGGGAVLRQLTFRQRRC